MKDDINDLRNSFKNAQTQNQQIANLAKHEFKGLIESLCASFHPNTRRGLLDQVELHVHNSQSNSRVMLITAGPGMGKSTLAAKICETYKKVGCLGGCHFFQYSNSTRNNPRLMLQSIARQMCDSIPGFEEVLEKKLQTTLGRDLMDLNCEELFTVLLEEPLHDLKHDPANGSCDNREFVVVLDAIDECCSDLKNEVEEIFRDKFPLLPSWLRFVITTRPSPRLRMDVSMYHVFIDPKGVQNTLDLEHFYKTKFEHFCEVENYSSIISQLVEMTEGLFLVAFFIVDYTQKEELASLTNLLGLFPNGISSVYEKYFQRAKTVLLPFISEEERFFKMLEAVVAAEDPIPVSMIYSILELRNERDLGRQERKTRKDALILLHSLFPSENDHVVAFHKTVVDWLMLDGNKEHEFSVRVEDGNEVLACQCYNALDDIRNGKKALDKPLHLSDSEDYALSKGWYYMENSSLRDIVPEIYFRDHFVYGAMICTRKLQILSRVERYGSEDLWEKHVTCWFNFCPADEHDGTFPFGRCVEFLLNTHAALELDKEEENREETAKTLDLLRKLNLSYYEGERSVIHLNNERDTSISPTILVCNKDDFLIKIYNNNGEIDLQRHKLDGTFLAKKSFIDQRKYMRPSPDHRFIVAAEILKAGYIDVIDCSTLERVACYKCPYEIKSCHVVGEQPWYIVANCSDGKIHVIEGKTGQTRYCIPIPRGYEIEATSRYGQMLIGDGWRNTGDSIEELIQRRKLYLCDVENYDLKLPISPIYKSPCLCDQGLHISLKPSVCFSQDGQLLVHHLKGSLYIHKTYDGSLYKHVSLAGLDSTHSSVLFLTGTHVVVYDSVCMLMIININTNEVVHRFWFPNADKWGGKLHVVPRKQSEPFTLLTGYNKTHKCVTQYIFRNLDLA